MNDEQIHNKPFGFINGANVGFLLNYLYHEHPQVIALVLAHLEPNKASVILQNFTHELQGDVTRRIACMDSVPWDVVRGIEQVLEKNLSTFSDESMSTSGGVGCAVELLNLVDRASEEQIIKALEENDPELAEEIKNRMFVFEDIVMLDDRAIQKVLREVDSQELAKALKTVDTEVQDRIFTNMSKRAATMLKEDMEYMGPIRLTDVEEAQQKIVSIIRHLEDTGEIMVASAGKDKLIW